MSDRFLNKARFAKEVEERVKEDKIGYMEAILSLCEEYQIDVEKSKKYLSEPLLQKLEKEARDLNYLPKIDRLDL